MSRTDAIPARFDRVHAEASVLFDTEPDQSLADSGHVRLQSVDLDEFLMVWGPLELRVSGQVSADRRGRAEGALDVTARNWSDMLWIATEAGMIPDPTADLLDAGLSLISRLSGSDETLDIPLSFRDGDTYLGPIRVGEAPRLSSP